MKESESSELPIDKCMDIVVERFLEAGVGLDEDDAEMVMRLAMDLQAGRGFTVVVENVEKPEEKA